ncbi:MAG TPA: ATP-binding protein [Burkholderiales bacterium]|nr:ATP-binding protein [Burkholderiales bacterium]
MQPPQAVIITPSENDATVALAFLREAGIPARACATLSELARNAPEQIGCAVLVEEALVQPELEELLAALAAQQPWSDLPLVLIASQGAALGPLVERVFPQSGNVAVLERPMNPVSLISAVRVGLRARQRQLEVRELLEQRANALRLREEFLAMLSHELRNPLAPMRNAVYLMKRLDIDNDLFRTTRELIDRQVGHMARLVDDLLDVSRLELGKVQLQLRELDLNAAVAAATEACTGQIQARRHELELRLAREPLYVMADPVRIEQIIGNLITNASKFTPEGGSIVVEAAGGAATATVTVSDSGVGIEGRMLNAVFELFTQDAATLERSRGGLGIGLTIVKRLVELHGGSVRVSSAGRDRGSRFTVELPRVEAGRAMTARPAQDARAAPSRRVLVIEDNPDVRESLGLLLRQWGHGIDYADSGPSGLQRADLLRPDVALIDIGLPGLNGYELAQRIRGLDRDWARDVKLIALTGYGRDDDRRKALDSGFNCHLVKPVDPEVLAEVLRAS